MTACRFYDAGYCKYGYRCRNYHMSGSPNLRRTVKPRSISPVWLEARKWRVLSEQDNLSSKFKFRVPSPTTKDWSVWDNSDSDGEYEPGQSKLMRLESATLSILQCPNCGSHILTGEGLDMIICETCTYPVQNSKFTFNTEINIESENFSIDQIAEDEIIEVKSYKKSSSDDIELSERVDNGKKIVKHDKDKLVIDSVDINQNNVACNPKNRKKKKNKQKKKNLKLSPVQTLNNNEQQLNNLPFVETKLESNISTDDSKDLKENVMKTGASSCPEASSRTGASSCPEASSRTGASSCPEASSRTGASSCPEASSRTGASSCPEASSRTGASSCPKVSSRTGPKGWKKRNSRKKMLCSSVNTVYSAENLQRAVPFTIPLLLVIIWAVFM